MLFNIYVHNIYISRNIRLEISTSRTFSKSPTKRELCLIRTYAKPDKKYIPLQSPS